MTIVRDQTNFSNSYIDTPVKAITNQDTTMMISFDDFARIFGGEWTLSDNVFEFTYDPATPIELSDSYTPFTYKKPAPSQDAKLSPVTFFVDMTTITVTARRPNCSPQAAAECTPARYACTTIRSISAFRWSRT